MYPPGPNPNQNPYAPQPPQNANPYAPPPQNANPYAPPVFDAWNDTATLGEPVAEGTYWGGFAAGFIFALLGLIVVHVVGKSETKRGALHGLGIRFALVLLVILFV